MKNTKIKPANSSYSAKLKDPRWQKKRLKILERDEFTCQSCFDDTATLHIHHLYYESGKEPWDYPDNALLTLCETCHGEERETRGTDEQMLLRALKEIGILSRHVNDLAIAFGTSQFYYPPFALIGAIARCLESKKGQEGIIKIHHELLKKYPKKENSGLD